MRRGEVALCSLWSSFTRPTSLPATAPSLSSSLPSLSVSLLPLHLLLLHRLQADKPTTTYRRARLCYATLQSTSSGGTHRQVSHRGSAIPTSQGRLVPTNARRKSDDTALTSWRHAPKPSCSWGFPASLILNIGNEFTIPYRVSGPGRCFRSDWRDTPLAEWVVQQLWTMELLGTKRVWNLIPASPPSCPLTRPCVGERDTVGQDETVSSVPICHCSPVLSFDHYLPVWTCCYCYCSSTLTGFGGYLAMLLWNRSRRDVSPPSHLIPSHVSLSACVSVPLHCLHGTAESQNNPHSSEDFLNAITLLLSQQERQQLVSAW